MAPARLGLTVLALAACCVAGYIAAASSCATGPEVSLPPEPKPLEARQAVEINGQTFEMEVALTHAQRIQGLSDRRSIDEDGGMLFVHPSVRELAFVMRRCHAAIDIVYLDPDGRVVAMHAMPVIEPIGSQEWFYPTESYPSDEPAQFALEFAAGTLETLDLEVGDVVDLPLEDLKEQAQ